jgi:molybdopterin synthase sulfur carrier subunit
MIKVKVSLFLMLREIAGNKTVELTLPEHSAILDLMNFLAKKFGKEFSRYVFDENNKVRKYLSFLVNGKNIEHLDGFRTTLNNGDSIVILPPPAGG